MLCATDTAPLLDELESYRLAEYIPSAAQLEADFADPSEAAFDDQTLLDIARNAADADNNGTLSSADNRAYAVLYKRHYQTIYSYACEWTSNTTRAHDTTQEVFLKMMTHIKTNRLAEFRASDGEPTARAWLLRVARNKLVDDYRKSQWERLASAQDDDPLSAQIETADDSPHPDEVAIQADELALLHTALAQLPPNFRQAVQLRIIDDLDMYEAAGVQGTSASTLRTRNYRGLQLLKGILEFDENNELVGVKEPVELVEDPPEPSPMHAHAIELGFDYVSERWPDLSAKHSSAMIQFIMGDITCEQAAQALNMKTSNVRQHVSKAMEAMDLEVRLALELSSCVKNVAQQTTLAAYMAGRLTDKEAAASLNISLYRFSNLTTKTSHKLADFVAQRDRDDA